jgi:hypothetical protein
MASIHKTKRTSITKKKRSITKKKRSITKKKRSNTKKKRSITKKKHSVAKKKRSITKKKHSVAKKKRSITKKKHSVVKTKRGGSNKEKKNFNTIVSIFIDLLFSTLDDRCFESGVMIFNYTNQLQMQDLVKEIFKHSSKRPIAGTHRHFIDSSKFNSNRVCNLSGDCDGKTITDSTTLYEYIFEKPIIVCDNRDKTKAFSSYNVITQRYLIHLIKIELKYGKLVFQENVD